MPTLYDEAGEAIEGALTPDEAKALQEKVELTAKELEETKLSLAGLQAKDMNFRRLEQMTEAEKAKLSAKEMELMKRQEELEDKQNQFITSQRESWKSQAISSLVGEDEELKAVVEEKYSKIAGEATTQEEITERVQDALAMARRKKEEINPVAAVMGIRGEAPKHKETNFADSAAGKSLAASLGMQQAKKADK